MARPTSIPISLVHTVTRDGVRLDGVTRGRPRGRRVALLWVHGLGSVFSSGQPLIAELSAQLERAGVGYFKLNTRGHDAVSRAGKRFAGAALERFGESVRDIRAMIALARDFGYRRIVLAGHSTGANKALHYVARTADRHVSGLMLLGPVSDVAAEAKRVGARELARRVRGAERLFRRDPDELVPGGWGYWSAERYLSLYRPGGAEDVFPYYRANARWTALRRVRVPIAAILGSRDEYLDRPPEDVIAAFARNATRARSFDGIVVPGALHGFADHEAALSRAIVGWLSAQRLVG